MQRIIFYSFQDELYFSEEMKIALKLILLLSLVVTDVTPENIRSNKPYFGISPIKYVYPISGK